MLLFFVFQLYEVEKMNVEEQMNEFKKQLHNRLQIHFTDDCDMYDIDVKKVLIKYLLKMIFLKYMMYVKMPGIVTT